MIQKAQRGGEARQTERKPEQQAKERAQKARLDPAAALTALMGGTALGQIPQQAALELQAGVGNSALLALLQKRGEQNERSAPALPEGALAVTPLRAAQAELPLTAPPDFAAFSPLGEGAPMEV